jgi:hypothetical protein
MNRTDLSVLFALERIKLARFWQVARRDRLFLIGAGLLVLFVIFGERWNFQTLAAWPAWKLAAADLALSALAMWTSLTGYAERGAQMLAAGPFQPLVATKTRLRLWLIVRAGWPVLLLAAVSSLVMLIVRADLAGPMFGLAIVGAAGCAALVLAWPAREGLVRPPAAASKPVRAWSPRPWLMLAGVAARRRLFGLPVWLVTPVVAALGWLAAPLAARNNADAAIGADFAAAAALLCAAPLLPGPRLIQALGRQPVGLAALYAWLFAPPALFALAVAGLGAVLCGAGPFLIFMVALSAGAGVAGFGAGLFLHSLSRSAINAPLALTAEAIGIWLFIEYMSGLLPAWIALRLYLQARAARRLRWQER